MVVSSDSASLVVALRLLSNIMRMRIMYIADILDVNNALCSNVQFTAPLRGYPRKKYVIDHDYERETPPCWRKRNLVRMSPKETLKNYVGSE